VARDATGMIATGFRSSFIRPNSSAMISNAEDLRRCVLCGTKEQLSSSQIHKSVESIYHVFITYGPFQGSHSATQKR
jgi:hypothetical protein